MLHAGLDLSRREIDVCLMSGAGEIVDEWASPPDADGLRGLAARAAMWAPVVRGVIESMNGARFVHDRLEKHGWDVLIADATKVNPRSPARSPRWRPTRSSARHRRQARLRAHAGSGARALGTPCADATPPCAGCGRAARRSPVWSARRGPSRRSSARRTSRPSGGVSARDGEGARPDGRMRLAPRVSIVASSSAPRRDVALRLTSGPGRKSCPWGQRATNHSTPLRPYRQERSIRFVCEAAA
jgi:hypothetical protein